MEGYPPCIPPHYLYNHCPVMRFCCGVYLIYCISGCKNGCIKSKGDICRKEVVINCLWYPDNRDPFFKKFICDCQSPITAYCYHGIYAIILNILNYLV